MVLPVYIYGIAQETNTLLYGLAEVDNKESAGPLVGQALQFGEKSCEFLASGARQF